MSLPTSQTVWLNTAQSNIAIGARTISADELEISFADKESVFQVRMTRDQAARLVGNLAANGVKS
jgi:flagellar basal body rod protein FlgC